MSAAQTTGRLPHWHGYSDGIERAKTKTLRALLLRDARIVGFTIEPDGVFIYTDTAHWCDDSGAGTFREDSETAAARYFLRNVQSAESHAARWPTGDAAKAIAAAAPAAPRYTVEPQTFEDQRVATWHVVEYVGGRDPHNRVHVAGPFWTVLGGESAARALCAAMNAGGAL